MKNYPLLILALFLTSQLTTAQSLQNDLYGGASILGEYHYLRLKPQDDKLLLRLPYTDVGIDYELEDLTESEKEITFTIIRFDERWTFSGNWENDQTLKGKVLLRGVPHDFVLHKMQSLSEEEWPRYLGTYRLPSGLILKVWERFNSLVVHSPVSERMNSLRNLGDQRFFTATGEMYRFSKEKDGQFQQLEWTDQQGNRLVAERFKAYHSRDVTIFARKDTIAGTLFIPAAEGKHPACLITPGAGRLDRTNNILEAQIFAGYGIATMVVDKPGTGQSSGDLWSNSFNDKRDLAVDLYRWMQQQPELDASRIGLWGASQGSRIAVMAAAEIPEAAFLVLAAHPIETMMNVQLYAIEQHLRGQFYPETIIVQTTNFWRKYYHQVSEQKIDTSLVLEAQRLRENYPELYLPAMPDTRLPLSPHATDVYSDPVDYLQPIKCPILSINGSLDERVPVQICVKRLEEALQKNGHEDYTKLWYSGANHSFLLPGFRIAPGLFMQQVHWMRKRLF